MLSLGTVRKAKARDGANCKKESGQDDLARTKAVDQRPEKGAENRCSDARDRGAAGEDCAAPAEFAGERLEEQAVDAIVTLKNEKSIDAVRTRGQRTLHSSTPPWRIWILTHLSRPQAMPEAIETMPRCRIGLAGTPPEQVRSWV